MKKLLLLVGLVVLFFAQSSYAGKDNKYYKGNKTGLTWENYHTWSWMGSLDSWDECCVHMGSTIGSKKTTKIIATFYHVSAGHNKNRPTWGPSCFDFSSKTYFNIDRCEEVHFDVDSYIKKKSENTRSVKNFINKIAKDVCENPSIIFKGEIKKANLLLTGESYGTIRCPKVLANKKRIEEEKKLAKQQAQQEQEQAMTKEKEQELLTSVNAKRELCSSMDFQNGTDGMANCILQLMLAENKKNEQQQVIITSGNDGLADAMDEQTRILSKQLRIQKIQHSRENLKRFNHMMNTGTIPTW